MFSILSLADLEMKSVLIVNFSFNSPVPKTLSLSNLNGIIDLYDSSEFYYDYMLDIEELKKLDLSTKNKIWNYFSTPWGNKLNLSVFRSIEASGLLYKISNS